MKKTIFLMIALAGTLLGRAQDNVLSEKESQEIVESPEFRAIMQVRNEVASTLYSVLKKGTSAEELKNAYQDGLATGDFENFYVSVFGTVSEAGRVIKTYDAAYAAFLQAFPKLAGMQQAATCKTCPKEAAEQFDFLLLHIAEIQKGYSFESATARTAPGIPTCGSYWNQALTVMCTLPCAGTGVLGLYCGWKCWCTFCHDNSVLAAKMCVN